MRVLVAPCTFKESLTASDVGAIVSEVVRAQGHDVACSPLADGGEGTLAALVGPLSLEVVSATVDAMLPALPSVNARFGLNASTRVAVLEAASVVGLDLVARERRDPLRATTRGLGQLMNAAIAAGARALWIGLGGTATIDGGSGMLSTYDASKRVSIVGLVDVDVPLAGARMFMAQKFAGPIDDATLDARTDLLRALHKPYVANVKGAGAAGGLGAALASLGGRLVSGADVVMREAHIEDEVMRADVVVTGEGRIDEQTAHGKLVAALAALCAKHGKRLVALCGAVRGDVSALAAEIVVVTPPGQAHDDAIANARVNVANAARRMFTGT